MEYLIPLAIFAALGILAGFLLTVASKKFLPLRWMSVLTLSQKLFRRQTVVLVAFQAVQTMPTLS